MSPRVLPEGIRRIATEFGPSHRSRTRLSVEQIAGELTPLEGLSRQRKQRVLRP